jgi:hypothetical protein
MNLLFTKYSIQKASIKWKEYNIIYNQGKVNKTTMRYHFRPMRIAKIKD